MGGILLITWAAERAKGTATVLCLIGRGFFPLCWLFLASYDSLTELSRIGLSVVFVRKDTMYQITTEGIGE